MAKQLRINPAAVARQLLTRLDDYKALTESEESRVIYAIESTGVPVERVLADLSKKSIREMLNQI